MAKPTKYLDSKKHRIYKGEKRGYFTKTTDGDRNSAPKASYRKPLNGSSTKKLTEQTRKSVPVKIRPSVSRIDVNSKGKKLRTDKPVINLTPISRMFNKIIPNKPLINLSGGKKKSKSGKLQPTVVNKLFGLKR